MDTLPGKMKTLKDYVNEDAYAPDDLLYLHFCLSDSGNIESKGVFVLPKKTRYYRGSMRLYKELYFYHQRYNLTFQPSFFDRDREAMHKNSIIHEVCEEKPNRKEPPYPNLRRILHNDFKEEDISTLLKAGLYNSDEDLNQIINHTYFNISTNKQFQSKLKSILSDYLKKYKNKVLKEEHFISDKRYEKRFSRKKYQTKLKESISQKISQRNSIRPVLYIKSDDVESPAYLVNPFVHAILLLNENCYLDKVRGLSRKGSGKSSAKGAHYEASIKISDKALKEIKKDDESNKAIPSFELTGKKLKYEGSSIPLERGRNKVMRELWDNRQVSHVKEYERNGEPVHREVLQNAGNYSEASFRDALRKIKKRLREQVEEGNFPPIKITNPETNHYLLKIKYKRTSEV
jgi:DNA-directed RNA polymerase beta subunit